jgi:hypothetical protein
MGSGRSPASFDIPSSLIMSASPVPFSSRFFFKSSFPHTQLHSFGYSSLKLPSLVAQGLSETPAELPSSRKRGRETDTEEVGLIVPYSCPQPQPCLLSPPPQPCCSFRSLLSHPHRSRESSLAGKAKIKGESADELLEDLGLVSFLPLTSCVTSDKSLNLSELPFPP